jgi:hypothetical protein
MYCTLKNPNYFVDVFTFRKWCLGQIGILYTNGLSNLVFFKFSVTNTNNDLLSSLSAQFCLPVPLIFIKPCQLIYFSAGCPLGRDDRCAPPLSMPGTIHLLLVISMLLQFTNFNYYLHSSISST